MAYKIQIRNGTASEWTSANPVLAQGEMGAETDTGKFKIGNGTTEWNSLAYSNATTLTQLGITATVTELNYVDGVTSSIQTQLNTKAPLSSPTFTGTVSGITKTMVGLGNVDNTSDANKPISTATQTALNGKAASTHSHAITDVTNLQTSLDGKAASTHSHAITDVTNLQTSLNGKENTISNGTTGQYFRGDKSWQAMPTSLPASDVYSWAKSSTKPTYTASEVGLGNVTNESKATMFTSPTFTGTPTLSGVGRLIADSASAGTDIYNIWSGTQAQYDAIGTKDANTLYFIS